MTQIARLYGSSMYDLAAEEQLTDTVLEQMQTIRQLFRENPDYVKLLSEPSIPKEERTKLLDTAFGTEAERYLVNIPDAVRNLHGGTMWTITLPLQW